jgi:uncharacterized protein (DUF433 family)
MPVESEILQQVAERVRTSLRMLSECVEIDPAKRSGVPVLRGTRFTLAQLLAELAEGKRTVDQIAEDFDLDAATARASLEGLSIYLDHPALP